MKAPDPVFVGLYAAGHYRYFFNDPTRTPWAGVSQAPPLQAIEPKPFLRDSEEQLARTLRELLLRAVAAALRGAERPAFTLSGGMDSSSVLSCAWKVTGERQVAFSAVYGGGDYDEERDIRTILGDRVRSWHPVHVDGRDLLARIDRAIAAIGEPLPTATWLANDHVCRAVSASGHDVLLGGLGGDELCAGEYEHFLYHFADLRAAGDEKSLDREIDAWARNHDHRVHRKSRAVAEAMLARTTDAAAPGRCRADRRRIERYAGALNRDFFDLRAFEPVMDHPFPDCLRNRTSQDLLRETIPPCLRAASLQAAHFRLRAEHPFLDRALVEFMFRVPGQSKIRDGVAKVILRRAMEGIVPDVTRTRVAKTGWNAPADAWFAGDAFDDLLDLIRSQAFRERGIYDAKEVERLALEHRTIVRDRRDVESHAMLLWQVVNLELWLRQIEKGSLPFFAATKGRLPLPRKTMGPAERRAVNEVIDSGVLSGFVGSPGPGFLGGERVLAFERAWSERFGTRHAISVNSATSGLLAALGAAGISPGDEVIVPPFTMSATVITPLFYGGIPVFADIEPETFGLDPAAVRRAISPRTRAIVAVNLFGHAARLAELADIAAEHGLTLIEDNSQGPLAVADDGRFAGTIGHMGVFSLNVHKHIQTGEGGVVVTADDALAERVQLIRNHGENVVESAGIADLVNLVGLNLRMTELTAAVAIAQLGRIDELVGSRARIAERLSEAVAGLGGLAAPVVRPGCRHVYYVWAMRVDERALGATRQALSEALDAEGFPHFQGYVRPLYHLPVFQKRVAIGRGGWPFTLSKVRYTPGMCPVAERLHERELIGFEPCAWELDERAVDRLAWALRSAHRGVASHAAHHCQH